MGSQTKSSSVISVPSALMGRFTRRWGENQGNPEETMDFTWILWVWPAKKTLNQVYRVCKVFFLQVFLGVFHLFEGLSPLPSRSRLPISPLWLETGRNFRKYLELPLWFCFSEWKKPAVDLSSKLHQRSVFCKNSLLNPSPGLGPCPPQRSESEIFSSQMICSPKIYISVIDR